MLDTKAGAVVLLSGGLDSTTLLYHMKEKWCNLHAISFAYGQRHIKEILQAKTIARFIGVHHELVEITDVGRLFVGSALTSPNVSVPGGAYTPDNMSATVVPNRNMIMMSIAVGYAITHQLKYLGIAAHGGDYRVYPDCRQVFFDVFQEAARLGNEGYGEVKLYAPFVGWSKGEIVRRGVRCGVPWIQTWSCYQGRMLHCGKCGTCIDRKRAFEEAGVIDPTQYQEL